MLFSRRRALPCCISVLSLSLLLLAVSCGGGGAHPDSPAPTGQRITSERVVLTVLPDTYIAGGKAQSIDVVERQGSGEILIDVSVRGAKELKAFFFHLEFDPARYGVGRLDNPWLLAPENECLALFLSDPAAGVVEFGELVMLPQEPRADGSAKGFSGDGLLCTLHLKQGPAQQDKRLSAAPDSDGARSILSYDVGAQTLEWRHFCPGDYNQDGVVAVSDLTPIGIHFNKDVPAGDDPDGRNSDSIEDVVDGSNDGKVNVSDLTAIGLNFQDRAGSYKIYRGSLADLPADNSGPNGPGATLEATIPFSQNSGNAGSARVGFSHIIGPLQGNTLFWVRPNDETDGNGSDGTASSTINSSLFNEPPKADWFGPYQPFEALPAMADFAIGDCFDPDGTLVLYEFDAESDGVFEQSSPVNPGVFHHDYNSFGNFIAVLRVTDDDGAQSSVTWDVDVADPSNQEPVVSFQASATEGSAPLLVEFSLAGSSDPDGQIVLYEFNLDGEPGYELSSAVESSAQFTYVDGGEYYPQGRVTDNLGRRSSTSFQIVVEDQANLLPTADVTVSQASGEAPFTVDFDASGSFDNDGEIVSYLWDFYGDGDVDLVSSEPFASCTYQTAGSFTARLVARDNDGGESAADTVEISVSGGWRLVAVRQAAYTNSDFDLVVVSDGGPNSRPLIIWEGSGSFIGDLLCCLGDDTASNWPSIETIVDGGVTHWDAAGVGGLAAIAYDPGDSAAFIRALDAAGTMWTAPVEIDSVQFGVVDSGISLDIVGGFPAVTYNSFNTAPLYARASDALGDSWGQPTLLQLDENTAFPQLIGGPQNPVVLATNFISGSPLNGHLKAYAGTDSLGGAWGQNVTLDTTFNQGFSGCSADGVVQICYSSSAVLWHRRATDPQVSGWGDEQIIANPPGTGVPSSPSMATIAGVPAVAFEVYPGQIWYTEAEDASGATWQTPVMLHALDGAVDLALASWNNRPAIAYGSGSDGAIYFLHLP